MIESYIKIAKNNHLHFRSVLSDFSVKYLIIIQKFPKPDHQVFKTQLVDPINNYDCISRYHTNWTKTRPIINYFTKRLNLFSLGKYNQVENLVPGWK